MAFSHALMLTCHGVDFDHLRWIQEGRRRNVPHGRDSHTIVNRRVLVLMPDQLRLVRSVELLQVGPARSRSSPAHRSRPTDYARHTALDFDSGLAHPRKVAQCRIHQQNGNKRNDELHVVCQCDCRQRSTKTVLSKTGMVFVRFDRSLRQATLNDEGLFSCALSPLLLSRFFESGMVVISSFFFFQVDNLWQLTVKSSPRLQLVRTADGHVTLESRARVTIPCTDRQSVADSQTDQSFSGKKKKKKKTTDWRNVVTLLHVNLLVGRSQYM